MQRPLISACLIVRDEEANLPRCLAALDGVVDEIVVHDTGSSDCTVAIATAAGATVIVGTWDHDFGQARNVALAACTGDWILHVDADEELQADPGVLRATLCSEQLAEVDACLVTIDNIDDAGAVGVRHRGCRLFRRAAACWQGRIHEQVVALDGGRLRPIQLDGIRIRHHGYLSEARAQRGKPMRNVVLAEAAARNALPADAARAHLDLARSLAASGRHEEALAHCETARSWPASRAVQAWIHRFGAEVCLMLGRPDAARVWVADLRAEGLGSDVADLLDGTALLMLARADEALELFDGLGEAWDATGISVPEHLVRQRRGLAHAATGDHEAAAAELLALVRERPATPVWAQLALASLRSDSVVPVQAVADAVADDDLRAVLLQLLLAHPDAAEALAQALWASRGPDPRLLGFSAHHAPRLDAGRGLEWSARLRAAGLPHHCPLIARAEQPEVVALERLLAAAVCHGTFGDHRAEAAAVAAAPGIDAMDLTEALIMLDELSPALLPSFVLAVAADPTRLAAVANALEALGATEQALLLRAT